MDIKNTDTASVTSNSRRGNNNSSISSNYSNEISNRTANYSNRKDNRQKQNKDYNHLTSFYSAPITSQSNTYNNHNHHHHKKPIHISKFSKKLLRGAYVQANFRFIVNASSCNTAEEGFYNPDYLIPWEAVEIVIVNGYEHQCVICLDYLTFPRFTKCGHVYCSGCILKHFDLCGGPRVYARCPICAEDIYQNDLKRVKFDVCDTHSSPSSGRSMSARSVAVVDKVSTGSTIDSTSATSGGNGSKSIRFQLLMIENGSLYPTIATTDETSVFSCTNRLGKKVATSGISAEAMRLLDRIPSIESTAATYSRITQCSNEYLLRIYREELQDLNRYRDKCLQCVDDYAFDVEALPYINQLIALVSLEVSNLSTKQSPTIGLCNKSNSSSSQSNDRKLVATVPTTSPTAVDDIITANDVSIDSIEKSLVAVPAAPESGRGCHYFYQSHDGKLIFLHPLSYKCIQKEYEMDGAIACALPTDICGSIIELSLIHKNERGKISFLKYLPTNCEIYLCEIDMRKLVSKETLEYFKDDFTSRVRMRKERNKQKSKERYQDRGKRIVEDMMIESVRANVLLERQRAEEAIRELQSGPILGQDISSTTTATATATTTNTTTAAASSAGIRGKKSVPMWNRNAGVSFANALKDVPDDFPSLSESVKKR